MEALKLIQYTTDGTLRIEVPEHFKNTQLEIIVIPLKLESKTNFPEAASVEKYFGTAKYPQTETNKTDVYNQ